MRREVIGTLFYAWLAMTGLVRSEGAPNWRRRGVFSALHRLAEPVARSGHLDLEPDPAIEVYRLANSQLCCYFLQKTRRPMLQPREREPPTPRVIDPAVALRGFFAIAQAWGLSNEDARALLGTPPERTFYAWRAGNAIRVPKDTLHRIGYIAGIFKALEILYSDPHLADDWIRRPNQAFGGQTPLQRMRAGDITDLAAVRNYLDAARAPWS